MSQSNGPRPTPGPQVTLNVAVLSELDQRSPLVTAAQLNAIAALAQSDATRCGA